MSFFVVLVPLYFLLSIVAQGSETEASKGTFEVHLSLINFTRWRGPPECCPSSVANSNPLACAKACSVQALVCLTAYDRMFSGGRCHFGNTTVQLVPPRVALPRVDRDFQFHIKGRWSVYFTLAITVEVPRGDTMRKENVRLAQHIESTKIVPSKDWYTFMRTDAASGVKFHYSYRFQCDRYFYGRDCSVTCRPRNGTHGHYNCSSTGKRICHPGWSGSFCNEAKCAKDCHMICEKSGVKCRCEDGWEGPQCNVCKKADKCVNGACKQDAESNKLPGTCECFAGWGGQNCEKDLHYCANHPGVCKNGGTCFNKEDPDNGSQQFRCRCEEGFTGPNCETEIAKSCLVNKCNRRGRCMRDATTSRFICVCRQNYFGPACELNSTECAFKYCARTGKYCEWSIHDNAIRCQCPAGKHCAGKRDFCASRPCMNGGTCVGLLNGYRCSCPKGLSGNRCQFNLSRCSLACRNGGRCRHTATRLFCDCPVGFTGATCQCPPCYNGDCVRAPGPEVGGGLEYRCICRDGFYGAACNRSLPLLPSWPTNVPRQAEVITPSPIVLILSTLVGILAIIALPVSFMCARRAYRRYVRRAQATNYLKNNRPATIQNDLHSPSGRPESPIPSATVHPQATLMEAKKAVDENLELPPPKVHNTLDQSVNLLAPSSSLASSPVSVVGLPKEKVGWPLPPPMPGAKDTEVFLSSPDRRRPGWFIGTPGSHATQV